MFHSDNLSVNAKNHLTIGQHDTVDLAKEFGTPLYVLDEDLLRANCRAYKQAIDQYYDGHGLAVYASKTLCTVYTSKVVMEEGLGADAVSGGELYTLHKAGFPMDKVFFHGNNKTSEELKLALDLGVGHIVVDNRYELELLHELAAQRGIVQKILFRIKPGIDAHTHDFIKTGQIDSKFGVALENGEAMEIHAYAATLPAIQIDGVHCHIGSQIFDVEPFCEAVRVMFRFIADMYEHLHLKLSMLNLGGGFGIRYTAEDDPLPTGTYIKRVTDTVREMADVYRMELPFLLFEPGRSIAGPAGITLYTVGGVKKIPDIRTYVSIDGGMTDNPRYILYGARYSAVTANHAGDEPTAPVTIAGKCCESGDLIQEHIMMPQVQVGDTLAVLATGAYNYSMSSNYNRIPRPPIVAVKGAEKKVIVKRETYEDLIRNDIL